MAQRDHFEHQLAAASGFAETDRGIFSGWRRHTRNLSLGVRNHQLIRVDQVSQGTLDTILVHPREVFRSAISASASAIVLAHNHPSGDPTPSEADIKVTRDLIRAGQVLKIDVLDHVILGRRSQERSRDYVSLRELGYFA